MEYDLPRILDQLVERHWRGKDRFRGRGAELAKTMKLSVVIPARDEEGCIQQTSST